MHVPDKIIALLTDFGNHDYFVGSVKGVILSINPAAQIVDITHDIPAQDIEAGAFTLFTAHSAFPKNTIFVGVVDPGVGSARRPIVIKTEDYFFVGPDNGLFGHMLENSVHTSFKIANEKYFRHPVSPTFHGRDIFGPVAAHLSKGTEPSAFGPAIDDLKRLPSLQPAKVKDSIWKGRIIHIDHFGNCITNITRETLSELQEERARLKVKGKTINSFKRFFTEEGGRQKLFAVWGSAGFLEIAALNSSAAQILKAKRGDLVKLDILRPRL